MNNHISKYLAVSLIILAGLVGATVGYFVSPQYKVEMFNKEEMGLGKSDKWLEWRYLEKMIAHHRGAILLAQQAKAESKRTEIIGLAEEILKGEPKLIEELYAWKKEWYGDEKQVKDPIAVKLGDAGDNFDLRFLNALIAHHENGILMTQEVRLKSSNGKVLDNADAVENFLKSSKEMLAGWRKSWYEGN